MLMTTFRCSERGTQSLEEELRRIDQEWEQYQQAHLFHPARGPARVPSKTWAIAKVVLFTLPVVMSMHLLLTGRVLLAVLVLACAGLGVCRAGAEYLMAENRDLAELRYQAEREDAQSRRLRG